MGRKWLVAWAASLALAVPAAAHHSFAMFDMKQSVSAVGTVTEFKWTNPHAFMHIDIVDASGKVDNWGIEMTSPNNLINGGWRRSSVKPGDKITVQYHPLLNGKKGGSLIQVTTANGTVLKNV